MDVRFDSLELGMHLRLRRLVNRGEIAAAVAAQQAAY
jgi:hypothetical protein